MPFQLDDEDENKSGYELDEEAPSTPEQPPQPEPEQDTIPRFMGKVKRAIPSIVQASRPALEVGGMLAGGALGATAGSAVPGIGTAAGGVIGAGLGGGAGRSVADFLESETGTKPPATLPQAMASAGQGVNEGMLNEVANPLVSKAGEGILKGVGAIAKPVLGKLTGAGTAAIEKALEVGRTLKGNIFKTQNSFDEALRGKISGEDIVENAKDALQVLKNKRATEYQNALAQIASPKQTPGVVGAAVKAEHKLPDLDITPIQNKVAEELPKFVRVDPQTGKPDWTRSALGVEGTEGVRKIQEIVKTLKDWGTKEGDKTVLGLDMLKRQLDDFYGETSGARSFVASMRNAVKDTITKQVPEYTEMTKKYGQATNLIKDIETALSLRKQGMSGRVVADQTLRRLLTSTQNNFELRKDLVDALSTGSGTDLMNQISGHVLKPILPRGLMGGASALAVGAEFFHLLNPSVAPLLLAASPRTVGEFLRVYGKGLMEAGKVAPMLTRAATYGAIRGDTAPQQQAPTPTQQPPATNNFAPQPVPQPQSQGGGLGGVLGKLDVVRPAYAAETGTAPTQPTLKPTGAQPNTPDASPASKSIRFAMQAYQRGDFSATMKALHKAVNEDPRLAREFELLLHQLSIEQEERQKRGIPTT